MKKNQSFYKIFSYLFVVLSIIAISCKKRDISELEPTVYPKTAEVFIDDFASDLAYAAFGGSDVKAFQVDKDVAYGNTKASMRFDVPNANSPQGSYAGGVFFSKTGRDLSGYNVLTFYIKASQPATIGVCGFGNDLGQSKYQVSQDGLAVNTNWKKVYLPIPDASKLTQEKGMFYYSAGPENGSGYTFWIDEVKFEKLGTMSHSAATILKGVDKEQLSYIGVSNALDGFTASYNLPNGTNNTLNISPYYLKFLSSNPSVATVNEKGIVNIIGGGSSIITALLDTVKAKGSLTISSAGAYVGAPVPTKPAADVISVFSDAYTNVKVDYYNGYWAPYQTTLSADFTINGDNVLNYSNFNFVGTQISSPSINISSKAFLHLDIFIPGTLNSAASFKVKVLDFGADAVAGGTDDVSGEVTFTASTLRGNSWTSLDIPFTSLPTLTTKSHIGQIIYEGANIPNFFADNIYFWSNPTTPPIAAPVPTTPAANVLSIFSDSYTNVSGTDFNPNWGQTTIVTQTPITGNNTLLYSNFNYQGIQFGSSQNISSYGFLHVDYYSTNAGQLKVYLISSGGVETPFTLIVPTSGWSSANIPLASFTPVALNNVIQMKFDGGGSSIIYLDNIYFYKTPVTPLTAAPIPTHAAANVLSIFSDSYSNVSGTDFNPNWGQTTAVTQTPIAGNNTLHYATFNYQGVQLGSNQDVSSYGFLHLDYYSTNASQLKVYLISPGGVETPYTLTVPTAGWNSANIALSAFAPVALNNVMQFKFDGGGNSDIFLDNIYFYKTSGGGSGGTYTTDKTIDFESSGFGASWTWNVFENSTGPALAFVANPSASGINTSTTVAKFTAMQAGQPYAGCETQNGAMGTFSIDAAHKIVKIMVYKTVLSDVGIKFAKPDGSSMGEIKVKNTVVNAWEQLTFDFTAQIQSGYSQIIIFPDFATRSSNNIVYFDNITFGN